jgi:hypothetical protein
MQTPLKETPMKIFSFVSVRMVFTALFVCLISIPLLSQSENAADKEGFYVGAELLNCTDLFIPTKWGQQVIVGTFRGVGLLAGYSFVPNRNGDLGYGATLEYIPLRGSDFSMYIAEKLIPFTNVRYQMMQINPYLMFRISRRFLCNLSFVFALAFSSYDYSDPFIYFGPLMSTTTSPNASDTRTEFLGGACFGVSFEVTNQVSATLNYRLFVGSTTNAEQGLYQGGTYLGATGGDSRYMKILAIGAEYRF